MKNLVIVESLTKAKTIEKYLNTNPRLKSLGSFKVVASFGHVDNLPAKELGVDVGDNFKLKYQILPDKAKLVDELKAKAKEVDLVWLASDSDYEGEKISDSLRSILKLKKYNRVTFTEITSSALEKSFLAPRKIDENMVDAQETRRILDRLVGFTVSPLLWKRYRTNMASALSAGRVQSALMHVIIDRENEIVNFKPRAYWYFMGDFKLKMARNDSNDLEEVKLYKGDTMCKMESAKDVQKLLGRLKDDFKVTDTRVKETKKSADMPYITSSLQQDAYNKNGSSIKRTMQLAQELYEKGYITYMRTDSYNISEDFKEKAEAFINKSYGTQYFGGGSTKRRAGKSAQEAHEAIRPSYLETKAEDLPFGPEHKKLYDMIWKRTVAYFMKPCIMDELQIKIADRSFDKDLYFSAVFSKVKFNGYMIVYGVKNEVYDFQKYLSALNTGNYSLDCKKVLAKNTWQSPPQRYNDSSIIKVLETEGIGRPSTYSSILSKLLEKQYLVKSDIQGTPHETLNYVYEKGKITGEKGNVVIGAEKTRLVPSNIGMEIDKFVSENFDYIVDKKFTANMETDLDHIAMGESKKLQVLGVFWKQFNADVTKAGKTYPGTKIALESQRTSVNVNGVDYILRHAKYGPVIEYTDTETNDKKYVNMKPYLKYVRKELSDVGKEEVAFIMSLPRSVAVVDGKPVELAYGPYSMYLKHADKNYRMPMKLILAVVNGGVLTKDEVVSVLTYVKKPKAGDAKEDKDVEKKKVVKKMR
jgi:DNA topoisomerase I